MRILALDIETSPNIAYTWGLWDQNVGLSQLVEPSRVLCFAAKWLDGKRIMFHSEPKDGHEGMVLRAHELLDEADAVLHYNGTKFDIPHLKREFLEQGLGPTSPFAEIDLLKTARRQFKFQSNKLEYVSRRLGLDGKVAHEGFGLWKKCLAGDAAAWRRMEKYNRQDVVLLEELYAILLPWIQGHPNRALHDGHDGCPQCGGSDLHKRGIRYTVTGMYQLWRCKGCGGYSRSVMRDGSTTRRSA